MFANSDRDAYDEVTNAPHHAVLSHELLASAAAYEAAKAYDHHCEQNGKPASHAEAKELCAAVSGGFVDRLVETMGLDYLDKHKAKQCAMQDIDIGLREEY